jgi:glycosyltransferase involved in cell wall biosynthesis
MIPMLHLRVVAGTGGGPEKTILNSPRAIRPNGFQAHVAYMCPPQSDVADILRRKAAAADCPLTIIEDRGPLDFRTVQQVVKLCRSLNIQLLQTHDYKSNVVGLLARRFRRMAMSTMLHGWTDMSGRMPLYKRIDQFSLRFFQSLICVSEDLVEECTRLKISKEKIHLVRNGIDTHVFCRSLSRKQAKLQVAASPDRILLGSVGRLSQEKGFVPLIQCVSELQREGYPIDLWIAGDGPQRADLEKLIGEQGLGGSVRLLGQQENLHPFYQAMDSFVLNSIREGLPNVLLEAMAFGTPVIATAIAGIPHLVRDGQHGRLIQADSPAQLKSAILEFLKDPQLFADMSSKARERIQDEFSFDRRMEKVADIYRKILIS